MLWQHSTHIRYRDYSIISTVNMKHTFRVISRMTHLKLQNSFCDYMCIKYHCEYGARDGQHEILINSQCSNT